MDKGKTKFKFNIKKRILPVVLVSVCMPLVLFVAIPFEVYANNMDEFLFSLSSFYPYCILFGFLLAAGTAGALLFLPEKAYRICYALILALSFLFFIQGTFLNFGMNSLAGDNLGTKSVHIGLKILDLFIWLAVLGAAVALSLVKDKKGVYAIVAVILSIVVIATQIITPLASTIKHPDVFLSRTERYAKENSDFKDEVLTCENLTSVSTERNIFYFVIDRFDEYYAETAYGISPGIYDNLDGFTWFKDNLSLYGHTFPSVAYMLTENEFDNEKHRKEYLETVYTENNTLSSLADNGYSVNLYTTAYYAFNTAYELPDYIDNVSTVKQFKTTRPMKLVKHIAGTSTYRCLPLFFKDWIYGVESRKFNECVSSVGENGYDGYLTGNDTVYKQAAQATFEKRDKKNFSFIHVEGCHDIELDYISKPVSDKKKNKITASVEKSFKIVNEYIDELKAAGVYKDATIIITGDHPDPIDDRAAPEGAKLTALFFKPSGEANTALKTSDAPVEHKDIWTTIMKSEQITDEGTGLFDVAENDTTRERKYIWHTYHSNKCDEYVYKITGSGKNFDNWELVELNHLDHYIMG